MTDYEIDALYKTGTPVSHAAGLWAVYAQGFNDGMDDLCDGIGIAVLGSTASTSGSTVATVAPVTVTDEPVANDPVVQPDPPLAA